MNKKYRSNGNVDSGSSDSHVMRALQIFDHYDHNEIYNSQTQEKKNNNKQMNEMKRWAK